MRIEKFMPAVVMANIFLLSAGLAGVSFGYALEISALLLFFMLLINAKGNLFYLLVTLKKRQPIIFALLFYSVIDFVNYFAAGNTALAWQKYRVTAVLMMVFVSLIILRNCSGLSAGVQRAVANSAVLVVICTLARYFLQMNLPLFYLTRFTLRSDYNMYATLLLTGLICLVFGVFSLQSEKYTVVLLLTIPTIIAVTILSGSRRVLILLPVVLPILLSAFIIYIRLHFGMKKATQAIAFVLFLTVMAYTQTLFLSQQLSNLDQTQRQTRSVIQAPGGETQLVERYETIRSSSLLTKRKVIWGVAWHAITKFSYKELIFGRGGGENILLYDEIQSPIDEIYPDRAARMGALSAHNMLLADLIDGGIIKLGALLALVAAVVYCCAVLAVKKPYVGLPIGLILAICLLNSLISNRFGLLYDRFFIVFSALAANEYIDLKPKTHMIFKIGGMRYQPSYRNGNNRSPARRCADIP